MAGKRKQKNPYNSAIKTEPEKKRIRTEVSRLRKQGYKVSPEAYTAVTVAVATDGKSASKIIREQLLGSDFVYEKLNLKSGEKKDVFVPVNKLKEFREAREQYLKEAEELKESGEIDETDYKSIPKFHEGSVGPYSNDPEFEEMTEEEKTIEAIKDIEEKTKRLKAGPKAEIDKRHSLDIAVLTEGVNGDSSSIDKHIDNKDVANLMKDKIKTMSKADLKQFYKEHGDILDEIFKYSLDGEDLGLALEYLGIDLDQHITDDSPGNYYSRKLGINPADFTIRDYVALAEQGYAL